MLWVAVGLKRGDQSAEARRENDEIAGVVGGDVGVGGAGRHEDGCSRSDDLRPVGVAKGEFAFQDMPRLVIGMVDVEGCRTAAAPFVDLKRCASRGERGVFHANHLLLLFLGRFFLCRAGWMESVRGTPPTPSNVRKVSERNDISLYFLCAASGLNEKVRLSPDLSFFTVLRIADWS